MPSSTSELDKIGLAFGTDKASSHHDYLQFYERYLKDSKDKSIKLLEIGVLNGASIKTWASYFRNGHIIGADISPQTLKFRGERIEIEILDQSNIQELVEVGLKHGSFDFIIEDGSHLWDHQIVTLQTLFPFLKSGGLYIVEDLQTNYGTLASAYRGVAELSCMEYLKRALDLRVADDSIDITQETDAFLRTYSRSMNFHFHKRACLIEKVYEHIPRGQSNAGPRLFEPTKPTNGDVVWLLAHIGLSGDILSDNGSVRSSSIGNIQGFSVSLQPHLAQYLRYKARFSDGSWSQWFRADEFAGTRGAGNDLTGFHAELLGELKDRAELTCIGAFREQAELVFAKEGICVPVGELRPLSGIQIIMTMRG